MDLTPRADRVLQRQCGLVVGARADVLALHRRHPLLEGLEPSTMLDTFIFASSERMIDQVMCGGNWCIKEGEPVHGDNADAAFAKIRRQLAQYL
jgi:formimidoylglutamate deiminase